MDKTPFRVKAESVEACNCHQGCNCQFGGYPNEGECEFVIGFDVKDGHFGNVSLKGLRAAVVARYPKAIHEGHGHIVLFVDEKASPEQVDAFTTILIRQDGRVPWEALAATVERFEGPIRTGIQIELAGERSRVRVPDAIDVQLTPLPTTASSPRLSPWGYKPPLLC